MVRGNPFKDKKKAESEGLPFDIDRIIEEEKAHNHSTSQPLKSQDNPFEREELVAVDEPKLQLELELEPEPGPDLEPKLELELEPMAALEDEPPVATPKPTQERMTLDNINQNESTLPEEDELDEILTSASEAADSGAGLPTHNIKKARFQVRYIIFALLALAVLAAVGLVLNSNSNYVELTTKSSGLNIKYDKVDGEDATTEVRMRVLAYDANNHEDMIYYIDTVGTAEPDGSLKVGWEVPLEHVSDRTTYNEICVLDSGASNRTVSNYCGGVDGIPSGATSATFARPASNSFYTTYFNAISCAFYVSPDNTGIMALLTGKNQIGSDQMVGCAGSAKEKNNIFGDTSFIFNDEKSSEPTKPEDQPETPTPPKKLEVSECPQDGKNYTILGSKDAKTGEYVWYCSEVEGRG